MVDDSEHMMPRREDYAPYDRYPAFTEGALAYEANIYRNPYDPNSAAAQAWDRGADYALRMFAWSLQDGRKP